MQMKNLVKRLWQDESGQDLVEYALLLVLVALAAITTIRALATAVEAVFTAAAADLAVTT
jgi:pilus assembly protein Flp/PilA